MKAELSLGCPLIGLIDVKICVKSDLKRTIKIPIGRFAIASKLVAALSRFGVRRNQMKSPRSVQSESLARPRGSSASSACSSFCNQHTMHKLDRTPKLECLLASPSATINARRLLSRVLYLI